MQIFLDWKCPRCGRFCGNGFTARCTCGWAGGLDPEDAKFIAKFLERAKKRDQDAAYNGGDENFSFAPSCHCIANRDGRCVASVCRGELIGMDLSPARNDAEAAKRYSLLAASFERGNA